MKKLILLLLAIMPLGCMAQQEDKTSKYLAGAIPVNEAGFVYFKKHYEVKGKSQADIYAALLQYTQKDIVEGADHLPQARITESDAGTGTIAANIEEYLYFKRKAWSMDRVRFYYQLIFQIRDSGFDVEMRNIRYLYDDISQAQTYRAEQWITDKEALNKAGTKLLRIPGKFRRFTIDRKDAIFLGAAKATGAVRKVTRTVEVEEEVTE